MNEPLVGQHEVVAVAAADAGQSTMSDLLTAALSLQNAQSSYISDYTDYQLKLLEYRQAIGQTTK